MMHCMLLFEVGGYEEAKKVSDVGVDAIIVQGREAGGHVIGQVQVLSCSPVTSSPLTTICVENLIILDHPHL